MIEICSPCNCRPLVATSPTNVIHSAVGIKTLRVVHAKIQRRDEMDPIMMDNVLGAVITMEKDIMAQARADAKHITEHKEILAEDVYALVL